MRVLIIKTSSMGDVIHTLPAVTDAAKALPGITFDWVVEENFSEIPSWHPAVKKIIPMSVRRWRRHLVSSKTWTEFNKFHTQLRENKYDAVIDAQGLLKSAVIASLAKGKKCGFDLSSAREPLASLFYKKRFGVEKNQHAIHRLRQLFSQALNYSLDNSIPDYGVDRNRFCDSKECSYLVFLHGTTWATKHWPEEYWIELAKMAAANSLQVKLLWGSEDEKARAERIRAASPNVEVLPKLNLSGIVKVLANAKGVVGVDTGFSHMAAALNVPGVSLYGPSNPALTGALGKNQKLLSVEFTCSPCLQRKCTYPSASNTSSVNPPCFATLPPSKVWDELLVLFNN